MEEQKKGKEIKMNPNTNKQDNMKLSYDQLKEIADKLWNDNKYLQKELQQAAEFARTINRLDYLFKVVEISSRASGSFNSDFVLSCTDEIEKLLTVPEVETKESAMANEESTYANKQD